MYSKVQCSAAPITIVPPHFCDTCWSQTLIDTKFYIPRQGTAGLHSQSPHNFARKFMRVNITKLAVFTHQSLHYTYYLSRHLHRYDCTNTLIYKHMTLRNILICDFSLGSLKSPAAEAGDFVKLMLLYPRQALRLIL